MPHIYSFFGHWFGAGEHIAGAILATALLMAFAFLAKRSLATTENPEIPDRKLSVRTLAELTVEALRDFVAGTMGKNTRTFLPLFGGIFLFIFINNALGIVPGFNPPTGNINTNFGVALVVFALTHIIGVREHGIGYLKHFAGPIMALAILMVPIELISHIVRPVSLSLRLYGNMLGDHTVLSIFTDLTKVGIPVIFVGLGLFISFVQAMVFTMLSMVYIAMAMEHDH